MDIKNRKSVLALTWDHRIGGEEAFEQQDNIRYKPLIKAVIIAVCAGNFLVYIAMPRRDVCTQLYGRISNTQYAVLQLQWSHLPFSDPGRCTPSPNGFRRALFAPIFPLIFSLVRVLHRLSRPKGA